ncbi:MAG: ADP-forming succinate--CoA ligase subunit beta [Nitrososphaerota archaeon]|nr:ADP-forming succinate--CoA ligase subunit beta [Nitrososphaerota archaeon]
MRLLEYEAKELFRNFGIPVPNGAVVKSPAEIALAIERVGLPLVVKAQVPVGGRGKAGGIKLAYSFEEAVREAENLLYSSLKGHTVRYVLLEKQLKIAKEYYLGVTIDQSAGKPVVMLSTEGGMDVEEIAKKKPESLISKRVEMSRGFYEFEARGMCKQLGLEGSLLVKVSETLRKLYEVFIKYDAIIAEINPLAITENGEVFAADAKIEIDDDALFRQTSLNIKPEERVEDPLKAEAIKIGVTYVRLDGDIGVIGSGAGLTMATIDIINDFGGKASNFLETGGGITEQLMYNAVKLLAKDERLKALFINLYGGINPMVQAANGIAKAYRELKVTIPILVKLVGNEQEKAWEILENAGIPVIKSIRTEDAVERLMKIIEGF